MMLREAHDDFLVVNPRRRDFAFVERLHSHTVDSGAVFRGFWRESWIVEFGIVKKVLVVVLVTAVDYKFLAIVARHGCA